MRWAVKQNGSGSPGVGVRTITRQAEMAAFDALPAELRHALNEHPLKLTAADARDALRQGFGVEDVLRAIAGAQ
jgi:hypothetical protein